MVELHEKALTKIDFSAKIWNFALKPLPRFVFENKKRTLSAHPFIALYRANREHVFALTTLKYGRLLLL